VDAETPPKLLAGNGDLVVVPKDDGVALVLKGETVDEAVAPKVAGGVIVDENDEPVPNPAVLDPTPFVVVPVAGAEPIVVLDPIVDVIPRLDDADGSADPNVVPGVGSVPDVPIEPAVPTEPAGPNGMLPGIHGPIGVAVVVPGCGAGPAVWAAASVCNCRMRAAVAHAIPTQPRLRIVIAPPLSCAVRLTVEGCNDAATWGTPEF
jgi:hypothetical protein